MKRIKDGKYYSPDIWAISYLLNEEVSWECTVRTIELDKRLDEIKPTEILRLYFLPKIFVGFSFLPDVRDKAKEIIGKIKNKEYVTYKHDCSLRKRGTKNKIESKIEEDLFNNLSLRLQEYFDADGIGMRQFPANFFNGSIREKDRVGEKFWIDILSVNKSNQLSVIELKADRNTPLDLFIQAIDYGIFAYLFRDSIADYPFINNKKLVKKVSVYLIAEKFHPAIVGDEKIRGVCSCLRNNDFFDIHLIQFEKEGNKIENSKEIRCV